MCACLPRTVGETSFRSLPHMGQRFSLTSAMASSRPPSSRGSSLRRITGLPSWGHSRLTIDLGTALFTFFRVSILLGSLKSSSSSSGSLSLRGGALDGGGVMVVEAIVAMETVGHDMASPPCPSLPPLWRSCSPSIEIGRGRKSEISTFGGGGRGAEPSEGKRERGVKPGL